MGNRNKRQIEQDILNQNYQQLQQQSKIWWINNNSNVAKINDINECSTSSNTIYNFTKVCIIIKDL